MVDSFAMYVQVEELYDEDVYQARLDYEDSSLENEDEDGGSNMT